MALADVTIRRRVEEGLRHSLEAVQQRPIPWERTPDDRVVIYTARGDSPEGSDPSEHPHVLVAVAVCESGQTIDEITDALRNWGDEPELQ